MIVGSMSREGVQVDFLAVIVGPPPVPKSATSASVSDSPSQSEPVKQRRPWVPPALTRHQSLTTLTQVQDPFAALPPSPMPFQPSISPYPPGMTSTVPGMAIGPYADDIPCSQGFCP